VLCHRLVLATASPWLRAALVPPARALPGGGALRLAPGAAEVVLPACPGYCAALLVRFAYTGCLRVHGCGELLELFRVARAVQVPRPDRCRIGQKSLVKYFYFPPPPSKVD